MAISKEKFLRLFLDEFRENLLAAENQIILLKNDRDNADALATLLRTLHTMKGSTRMLQFTSMEKAVHGTETVFKGVRDGRYAVDARLVRFFFIVADRLRAAADSVERGEGDSVPALDTLLAACERLGANEPFDLSSLAPAEPAEAAGVADVPSPGTPSPGTPSPGTADSGTTLPAASGPIRRGGTAASARGGASARPAGPEQASASDADDGAAGGSGRLDSTIRVDSGAIDRSITLVNTLTIRQLRLRSASDLLDGIEKRLGQSWRSATDLKALRKELSAIARSIRAFNAQHTEQLFEIDHGMQELRETVIGMRMLPLSMILDRFPRMVEETASALGKDVCIVINGDGVRLDRTVLAKLSDPLIHLVRNAIDHGIEAPDLREREGKKRRGTIGIECRTEGNRISVTVSDDGAGLDYDAIRAKAVSLWPDQEPDIRQMDREDLVHFLFRPGFTTRGVSSTLSGRGIGLDIVKTNVESAKGQIQLESAPGAGCRFTLLLPVSASTMDGMFVQCAGRKYFIPAPAITRTLLIDPADCFRVRQKEMFNLDGVNIPLADLALGLQADVQERSGRRLPVLLVRGPAETVGIAVERILGYDSLVYQALPPGLRRNGLVQGVVFDPSFNIIPILNMWAVLERLRSVRVMDTHRRFIAAGGQERPVVLVADDSISTREIVLSMLGLEGYETLGAIDGLDALEKLHGTSVDLIVSDLNMPRMDGLKLLENIRNDEALKRLPVIIITTVDDEATRDKAASLGVDRYILKSSFEQDNLVSAARELLARDGKGA